ncbi:MAG: hypothetical protein M1381_05935 [Deltaproteobacteria bacterium]|nr:hypothetical protein [Deltaproteobacteria bacterium]
MNDRRIVSTVIRIGSYTGIGLLVLEFLLELLSNLIHIQAIYFKALAFSGIMILIFTPVSAMVSVSVYFAYNRQWKWAFASIFAGVLIAVTYILVR